MCVCQIGPSLSDGLDRERDGWPTSGHVTSLCVTTCVMFVDTSRWFLLIFIVWFKNKEKRSSPVGNQVVTFPHLFNSFASISQLGVCVSFSLDIPFYFIFSPLLIPFFLSSFRESGQHGVATLSRNRKPIRIWLKKLPTTSIPIISLKGEKGIFFLFFFEKRFS